MIALSQHASDLLYCVTSFDKKSSTTLKLLIIYQKHLFEHGTIILAGITCNKISGYMPDTA